MSNTATRPRPVVTPEQIHALLADLERDAPPERPESRAAAAVLDLIGTIDRYDLAGRPWQRSGDDVAMLDVDLDLATDAAGRAATSLSRRLARELVERLARLIPSRLSIEREARGARGPVRGLRRDLDDLGAARVVTAFEQILALRPALVELYAVLIAAPVEEVRANSTPAAEPSTLPDSTREQLGEVKSPEEWEALAVGILATNRANIRTLTDLYPLLQQCGYPHGRSAIYKLPRLLHAAEAAGVYRPKRVRASLPRGSKHNGRLEAADHRTGTDD